MKRLLALGILLLLPALAWADDPPTQTPMRSEAMAAAVLDAFERGEATALAALVAKDQPDPWLVADALCLQGKREAATAYAKAASRKSTKGLAPYVVGRRDPDSDRAAFKALYELDRALAIGTDDDVTRAMGVTEQAIFPLDTVLRIRAACSLGMALRRRRRQVDCEDTLAKAAAAAEKLGWFTRASEALSYAGTSAWRRSAWDRAYGFW